MVIRVDCSIIALLFEKLKLRYDMNKVSNDDNEKIDVVDRPRSSKKHLTMREVNELVVAANITAEAAKVPSTTTIREGFTEKVITYGYIMLFACSFCLGPLVALIVLVIELRVDAKRLLWIFQRPVGYKAQDIGIQHVFIYYTLFAIY